MKSYYALLLIGIYLGGCTTVSPSVSEYTIVHTLDSVSEPSVPSPYTLKILAPKAPPSLSTKEFHYVQKEIETGSYLYSRWIDSPIVMMERLLYTSLQENGIFLTILPSSSGASNDLQLEWIISDFSHHIADEGRSFGVIDLTCTLINTKTKKAVGTKRIVVSVPASAARPKEGVKALRLAASQAVTECSDWLRLLSKGPLPVK